MRLSICIPTYNFGEFIGQTLDSIIPYLTEDVEVIILDGGSTDDTANVVAEKQQDCQQIEYHKQDFRGGIDRDIEKVISLANGKYCWLFSADDIMVPDAIDKIMQAIISDDDVYLCEHDLCDLSMNFIREYPIFKNISSQRVFNLSDASDNKLYFQSAKTSEAFFSYLSAPIFKKEVWDSVDIPESFRETYWIVAGHLLSAIPKGMTLNYLGETFLHKREGNDSFSNGSVVHRHRITIEFFHHIANSIFGEKSEEALHIKRVLHLDCTFFSLLSAKLQAIKNPEKEDIAVLNRIAQMHYSNSGLLGWLLYNLYKITPVPALILLVSLKNLVLSIKQRVINYKINTGA